MTDNGRDFTMSSSEAHKKSPANEAGAVIESNDLRMCLDVPAPDQACAFRHLKIQGWAIQDGSAPLTITGKVDDHPWVKIPHGEVRYDVAKAFPHLESARRSGFSGYIDIQGLQPAEHQFTLRICRNNSIISETRRKFRLLEPSAMTRETVVDASGDCLQLALREPGEGYLMFRGAPLRVEGWATAKSGIERVQVWLDGDGPQDATYGILRGDANLPPDSIDASRSGFLAAFPTTGLDPGTHILRIIATSHAGTIGEITAPLQVDTRTEYDIWAKLNSPNQDQLLAMLDQSKEFRFAPKISILTPVYRTPETFLKKCVDSVKRQTYPNWELVLVDDASGDSNLTRMLESFAAGDRRIRFLSLPTNMGIAGASNAGLDACQGEYVGLLDHDDELSADALYEVVRALNKDASIDVFYSDEDKLDESGKRRDAFFKPDWSPDLLLSTNYVCHFLVSRRSLLEKIGGFRLGFDGSQDYDLILRLSEETNRIRRIPKILYHWRIHPQSTASNMEAKPEASAAGQRALEQHLRRRGVAAQVSEINLCRYHVHYDLVAKPYVRIIVPTGGSDTLEAALQSVLENTTYPNYEITVVDNSKGNSVQQRIRKFSDERKPVDLLDLRNTPFNFSFLCNQAARTSNEPYLLFLNDDTSIISPDWIEAMLQHAQREEVGVVGAQLLFPNNCVQHAGVVTGLMGIAYHAFRGLPPHLHYFGLSQVIRNCAAVTGACMLTRRDAFEAVGGFEEQYLPTCYQDVDFCLKMIEKGYRVVYTPFAKLYHYESYSKNTIVEPSEIDYMRERWSEFIANDPFYNPNLTRRSDDYGFDYDGVFDRASDGVQIGSQSNGGATNGNGSQPQANGYSRPWSQVDFDASPNPSSAVIRNLGQTTLSWSAPGVKQVQVRIGSPSGKLFATGGPAGKASTGPWVEPDTVFYLLDASNGKAPSPEDVLATVRVAVGLRASARDIQGKSHHA